MAGCKPENRDLNEIGHVQASFRAPWGAGGGWTKPAGVVGNGERAMMFVVMGIFVGDVEYKPVPDAVEACGDNGFSI